MKRKLMYNKVVWLICILLMNYFPAHAQHQKVKPFFPKNFAKRTKLERSNTKQATNRPHTQRAHKTDRSAKSHVEKPIDAEILSSTRELPLQALSGYIWGADPTHLRDAVKELVNTSVEKKIGIGKITVVAPPDKLLSIGLWLGLSPYTETGEDRDMVQKYVRVADRFELLPELPESVAFINHSPAWVLHSKHGDIVLESTHHTLDYYLQGNGTANLKRLRVNLSESNAPL